MMRLNRLRPTPQQRDGPLKRRRLSERHMRLDAIPAQRGQKHAGLPALNVLALDFLNAPAACAAVEPFGVLVAQPRELGPADVEVGLRVRELKVQRHELGGRRGGRAREGRGQRHRRVVHGRAAGDQLLH